MAVRIGDVTIRIGASTKQLEYDLRRAEKSLQATADKFKDLGQSLTLGITAPVAAAGAAAIKMASDYEESLNKVRVAFGESATSVEEFAKTTLENIGLAEGSALEMASLFGDMATSMGLTQPAAAEMSKSLVTLAGDLASFKNIGIEEAQTALSGVFTGETESLKRLGYTMLQTDLQAFALTKGINKKIEAMTQAEKVNLRYAFILNATKNAQGDFARTSGGAANQMRTFQEALKEAGQSLGKILLPAFTYVISKINDAIKSFKSLSTENKNLVIAIASVAAAIGPLLYTWGKLTEVYKLAAIPIARLISLYAAQKLAAEAAGTASLTAGEFVSQSFKKALIASGPYIAAFAAIGVAIYAIYTQLNKTNEELVDFNKYSSEATTELSKQRAETDSLIRVIKDENATRQDKIGALNKLQEISPEYFKNLSIEKSNIKEITSAYDDYIANIERSIKANLAKGDLEKQLQKEKQLLEDINKTNEQIAKAETARAAGSAGVGGAQQISNKEIFKQQRQAFLDQLDAVQRTKDEINKYIIANTELNRSVKEGGGGGGGGDETRGVKTLKTLETTKKTAEDLIPLFADLAKETEKSNLIKLGQSVRVVNPELNQTAAFLKQVGDEIAAIQVRADRGFITQAEADIEKAGRIKQAIQEATEQGLGTGVVDGLQGEFDKLNVNKLIENLEGKLKKIVEFVGPIFSQLGATFGAIFAQRGAEIDQYYEKEKARIEGSLMTEESKAAAIQKLDEQTQKKKAALARKQAMIDKASAIFSASVEGASAIIKGLKYGPIYAGIIGALVAAQIAAIAATPLPSLAIGTDMVKRDGLAMIHKGEAIVPANVVKGGFTGGGVGQELYGRLSGIDLIISNRNSQKYLNRIG